MLLSVNTPKKPPLFKNKNNKSKPVVPKPKRAESSRFLSSRLLLPALSSRSILVDLLEDVTESVNFVPREELLIYGFCRDSIQVNDSQYTSLLSCIFDFYFCVTQFSPCHSVINMRRVEDMSLSSDFMKFSDENTSFHFTHGETYAHFDKIYTVTLISSNPIECIYHGLDDGAKHRVKYYQFRVNNFGNDLAGKVYPLMMEWGFTTDPETFESEEYKREEDRTNDFVMRMMNGMVHTRWQKFEEMPMMPDHESYEIYYEEDSKADGNSHFLEFGQPKKTYRNNDVIGFGMCENGVLATYRNYKSEMNEKENSFASTTTHFVSRLDYPLLAPELQALFEVPLYPVVRIKSNNRSKGIEASFTCHFDDTKPSNCLFNCCCEYLRVDPFAFDDDEDDFWNDE